MQSSRLALAVQILWIFRFPLSSLNNPITRFLGTPACFTTKQAGSFFVNYVGIVFRQSALPTSVLGVPCPRCSVSASFASGRITSPTQSMSSAFLCPLDRISSDDFHRKSHFHYFSVHQNLHISKKMRTFALDFKSVLFSVWSNRLWPYIPMSYNRPLRPATASTKNRGFIRVKSIQKRVISA